jgi:sulfur-carrier protein
MKILYFARFRQIIGRSADDIALPEKVTSISALIDHLSEIDPACAAAFTDRKIVRAAIDKQHAALDASIVGATEVALFPPVTGG